MQRRSAFGFAFVLVISLTIALSLAFTLPNNSSESGDLRTRNFTKVTPLNFVRAETNDIMRDTLENELLPNGLGVNQFLHYKTVSDADFSIVRPNTDTLYSLALIDTDFGPVQISLPPVEDRYMSIICTNEDHYLEFYSKAPAVFHLQKETVESRYLLCIIRTALKFNDIEIASSIQDRVKIKTDQEIEQTETLDIPYYDPVSLVQNRLQLRFLFNTLPNSRRMFGERLYTDEVAHLLGVAGGFGGLPENLAYYTQEVVEKNDGDHEYFINVRDVPINAFWSVTVYDKYGFLFPLDSVSINSYRALPNEDGSFTIHFSNDNSRINNIHISDEWNYCVRMYEPQQPIIDGEWDFPKAEPL